MGYKNQDKCYEQTIFDQYSHFKKEMTLGEVRALNYAQKIAGKFGSNDLQKQYLDQIDKKLGLNSLQLEIPPEDFSKLISSLQSNDQLSAKNILVQAQMTNSLESGKQSHIFQVQIDPQTKQMLHNNSDGTKVLYSTEELSNLKMAFKKVHLEFKSDIHKVEDLIKVVSRQFAEAEIENVKFRKSSNSKSKTSYSSLLSTFLKMEGK